MITCNILFSGIGAQEAALKRLGLDFEVVGISEIDKYAIQSYEAINGPTRNYGDITQIERLDYADLWTYSSPCQDFSTAGRQEGLYKADGSLTRSGLLLHVERLLTKSVLYGTQPKYLLLENVKALVSKKFMPDFQRWLDKLEQLGYNNYWQVLNAKDYGIPQNRERVFVVSIRKDIDTKGYKFPSPIPLKLRLKDVLEPCVDEKYYLSADKVEKLTSQIKEKDVSNTIRCGGGSLDGKHTWDIVAIPVNLDKDGNARAICNNYSKQGVNNILGLKGYGCTGVVEPLCAASRGRNPENPSDRTAGSPTEQTLEINYSGCSNTLTSVQKDNYVVEPLLIKEATQKGYAEAYEYDSVSLDQPNSKTRRGRVGKQICNTLTCSCNMGVVEPKVVQVGNIVSTGNWDNPQRGRIDSPSGISPALNTVGGGGLEPKITEGYRIRKLTPRECWRLMAFTDVEFDCAKLSGVSDSRLYQQAGNSIVVDVLVAIFRELFND